MPHLTQDVIGRVERLPKPNNWRHALLPIFEAVMNGIHAIQEKGGDGNVEVTININEDEYIVKDNGIGLNKKNYESFKMLDSRYKIKRGGKGIGRLLWLQAFKQINVNSTYKDKEMFNLKFDFNLSNEDTIKNETLRKVENDDYKKMGTKVFLKEMREVYKKHFPKDTLKIKQGFIGHFWPIISISENIDIIVNVINGFIRDRFSVVEMIKDSIIREEDKVFSLPGVGEIEIVMMECKNEISGGEKKKNYLLYTANDRIVTQQAIDSILGVEYIDNKNKTVFRGMLKSMYLDENVNQERTGFNFPDEQKDVISKRSSKEIEEFIKDAIQRERKVQRDNFKKVISQYPSLKVMPEEKLIEKLEPFHKKDEDIYSRIALERFRAEKRQRAKINKILNYIESDIKIDDLNEEIIRRAREIQDFSANQLTEYVMRRHVLTQLLDKLIRIRKSGNYSLERVLHNIIIPQGEASIGKNIYPVAHDLWIIDEGFVFSTYIASDKKFSSFIEGGTGEKADLIILDKLISFGDRRKNPKKVYIVEFKRPMRKKYDEPIQSQITKYIEALKSGKVEGADPRVRVPDDAIFNCYVIADIVGDLDSYTRDWAEGQTEGGRMYNFPTGGKYRGFIEVIPWDQLIINAKERNKAFFEKLGLENE